MAIRAGERSAAGSDRDTRPRALRLEQLAAERVGCLDGRDEALGVHGLGLLLLPLVAVLGVAAQIVEVGIVQVDLGER